MSVNTVSYVVALKYEMDVNARSHDVKYDLDINAL